MNIEMIDIKEFNKNNRNSLCYNTFVYSLIVGVLIVSLGIFLVIMNKDVYYQSKLMIDENENIIINVLNDDLIDISKNDVLIIDNVKYHYDILKIRNIDYYSQVLLDVELGDLMIRNNTLNSKILLKKESLGTYFVRMIGGKK